MHELEETMYTNWCLWCSEYREFLDWCEVSECCRWCCEEPCCNISVSDWDENGEST